MKIVGIIASPHVNGNGATLVREALRAAKEEGASVTEVLLSNRRIEFCRDCRACVRSGCCVIDDDFHEVRALLSDADGIILSSPTYGAAMSARVKNLFDRLGQYAFLTSTFGGRYVAGIATGSSFGAEKVARQLDTSIQRSVFRRAYVSSTLGVHLRGKHVSSMPDILGRASAIGRRLAHDVSSGRKFLLQNLPGRASNALIMRPLIRKGIQGNKETMKGVYEELVRIGVLGRS